jgi:hypothetical protein
LVDFGPASIVGVRPASGVPVNTTLYIEVTMHNARFRLMAAMAGATMCLFAANANGQNTNTTTGTTAGTTTGSTAGTTTDQNASASTQAGISPTTLGTQPGTTTGAATTGTVDNAATTQTFDNTTPTTTTETRRGFPWGLLGLLGLVGLMKRGSTEVRRDTYATTGTRNVGTASADDRMNLTPRAASGTGAGAGSSGTSGTSGSGSMGDPSARR